MVNSVEEHAMKTSSTTGSQKLKEDKQIPLATRGRILALSKDQELPLAPEWAAFSRLSPDV
jgi:hypothetical protein